MLDKTTIGFCLEGLFVVAGLIVLIRLWRSARHDPASSLRRLPPRNAFTADILFFLVAVVVSVLFGWLGATLGHRFFPNADFGQLTLSATFVMELGMISTIVIYWQSGWSATSGRAAPIAFGTDFTPEPPQLAPLPAISTGIGTFLAAMPIVWAVTAAWTGLLTLCGYPVAHQTLVEVFLGFDTPLMKILFTIVAAVIVPFNEEIIFRGGLFRGLLPVMPRRWAIAISALVFAAMHNLDVTSFAPLAILGVIFALAYERTGNIRTVIIAHALFNLNTLVGLLLGINS
jgi:hypothetical protein